ncbi:MAG: hypothetical protein R2856_27000 [Caldilineaceae bacterium]
MGEGDLFRPVPPLACADGAPHRRRCRCGGDGYPCGDYDNGITVPPTPTFNPSFADMDGSPYEGMVKPLCATSNWWS